MHRYKKDGKDDYDAVERIQLTNNGSSGKMIELVGMDQIAEYQLHSDIEDVELCDSAIISLGESLPLFSSARKERKSAYRCGVGTYRHEGQRLQ